MAHVERYTGEQVGGADGGEIDAQRADRHAVIGPLGGVHGKQVRVTAQRFAPERAAPGFVATPGGAVEPAGAVPASPGSVNGRPRRQCLKFDAAASAAGNLKVAQQIRMEGQAIVLG